MAQLHPCLSKAQADALYLKLTADNDPLTGELLINPSSGDSALNAQKDIKVKAGQKVIMDGS